MRMTTLMIMGTPRSNIEDDEEEKEDTTTVNPVPSSLANNREKKIIC